MLQDENMHLLLAWLTSTQDFCLCIKTVGQTTLKYNMNNVDGNIKESIKKKKDYLKKKKKRSEKCFNLFDLQPEAQVLPEKILLFCP